MSFCIEKILRMNIPYIDGDQATAEVIINSFFNIGLERLTEGKMCCIHFTEKLLKQKLPTLF